eukprot:TRINITY_DN6241_c0_g1_i1.p1 TRINITY_DN6241_c0_g1~~TRINITY_DN6241_c0_g1_i1.p1  ORF type:complete len:107 (+),score=24.55 TRINITY_DN6241_c0_g1_i1:175-495(+)
MILAEITGKTLKKNEAKTKKGAQKCPTCKGTSFRDRGSEHSRNSYKYSHDDFDGGNNFEKEPPTQRNGKRQSSSGFGWALGLSIVFLAVGVGVGFYVSRRKDDESS